MDSGLIKVKDEPLSEEPLRTLTPPTADAYIEQQLRLRQLEMRGSKLPLTFDISQFTPQEYSLTKIKIDYIYNQYQNISMSILNMLFFYIYT